MFFRGGHNLGWNLPPLGTLILRNVAVAVLRTVLSSFQPSQHFPSHLLCPPRLCRAPRRREGEVPCFLRAFGTSRTLEQFYNVPSVNSSALIMHGLLLT